MTEIASQARSVAPEHDHRAEHGAVLFVPLNRLKRSPRNVRKVPHSADDIAQMAASIAAKAGVQPSQPLVVEPELADGQPTGLFLVTAGEGRRLGLALLARQKTIRKTHPVRCILDTENDPEEVSLDENVTRAPMHPADQFEAFKDQQDRRGLSAEDIAARFGVRAQVVRQRLRLGAASPALMAAYRTGDLTLEQLTAYCLTDDPARQQQVFAQLGDRAAAYAIRRAITQDKVDASDRRAVFVGVEAYQAAGGRLLRDLFTEDGGGWLEDVGLLDRLVADKLDALAAQVQAEEGWTWTEAHLDYPHGHGLGRVYPGAVIHSEDERARFAALGDEQDALANRWEAVEDLPPEVEARFQAIALELDALNAEAYAAEDIARAGVFVVLGYDGQARIERGLVRAEDQPVQAETAADADTAGDAPGAARPGPEPDEPDGLGPLPDRLVADLTAHRTLGLRDALAAQPTLALAAVVHALALRVFYPPCAPPSCLALRLDSAPLETHAPGLSETPLGRAMAQRHEAWAKRLPQDPADAWGVVESLDGAALLDLLAYCAAMSVNAVQGTPERRPGAWAHADALAMAAALDMRAHWRPTVEAYLGRVTKARILEAVTQGASPEAAGRLADLKKADMAAAAEAALSGTGWLPPLLRTGGSARAETLRRAAA